MIHRNKSTKYQSPSVKVTQMVLESNFCQTVRFNAQVKELDNMNAVEDSEEIFYFES